MCLNTNKTTAMESVCPASGPAAGPSTNTHSSSSKTTALTTPYEASPTAPIRFKTVNHLFDTLAAATGDSIRVENVSVSKFYAIEKRRDSMGKHYRFFYQSQSRVLVVTIPTRAHEILHRELSYEIVKQVDHMGLRRELVSAGATTCRHMSGGSFQGSSEGDSVQFLTSQASSDSWPVLVIEAGYSQSLPSLRVKARNWFYASNFEVKIVIIAKMTVSQGEILLEKWKAVPGAGRMGATETRASATLPPVPDCVQTIRISRPDIANDDERRGNPSFYSVARGALRLEFSELFLREPHNGEADIVIDEEELKQYAATVWMMYVP